MKFAVVVKKENNSKIIRVNSEKAMIGMMLLLVRTGVQLNQIEFWDTDEYKNGGEPLATWDD